MLRRKGAVTVDIKDYFDQIILINLKRRRDRLQQFIAQLDNFPFRQPEIFAAVDGSQLPVPANWQSGSGAWGCMQSHRQVLERAIMNNVKSLLVLEDDAIFRSNFSTDIINFLNAVPAWEGLMLGGQHMVQPEAVAPGIVRCINAQRTHAYALRPKYMRAVYAALSTADVHCDWVIGGLQKHFMVYAPDPFLIAQAAGKSDINWRDQPQRAWIPITYSEQIVLLNSPSELQPGQFMPSGLDEVFQNRNPVPKLRELVRNAQEQAISRECVLALWHPKLSRQLLRRCWRGPITVANRQ